MDATKRPLLIPPEFSVYAEKHGIFQIYEKLIQKLIINQPADPLQFMIDHLQEPNDDVPMIIIHGPPGSGKRSMTKMVADQLGIVQISKESLIGEQGSEQGSEQDSDGLSDMIVSKLKENDCMKKGWILDGIPENRQQALAMQDAGIMPSHFVLLDVPDTVLIERVMGKRIDPVNGDVYHTTFDPPLNHDILKRLVLDPESSEDIMIERLLQYHRSIPGILTCFQHVSKKIDADQPKSDIFAQVMNYLKTKKRTVAPHTPRVILLGPTGCGKSVQASLLASKYQLLNVNCEELLKQALSDASDLQLSLKSFIDRGEMIPDDLILKVLTNRLGQLDAVKRGWVVHGFPKTRDQCEALTFAGYEPNRVIFLDVPTDTILERLTLRGVDPISGERYHQLYAPPRNSEIKNRLKRIAEYYDSNSKAETSEARILKAYTKVFLNTKIAPNSDQFLSIWFGAHPDDEETAVLARISEYQAHHEDLQGYYRTGQRINADQDLQTVFECVESIIVNPLPITDEPI